MWTHHAPDRSPTEIADRFASTMFEEEREVADLTGAWHNRTWRGAFSLVGGRRVYRLQCDAEGRWTVEPEPD